MLCACALLSLAADHKNTEAFAVVAGTVFRDPGFAVPGAKISVVLRGDPNARKLQAVSNARGEFAIRVPANPGTYLVSASFKGFRQVEKEAVIGGEGRVDVTLTLTPESK